MGITARVACASIELYQRHLSPRKGYSCAHRVVNGGPGCSAAVRDLVIAHGVRAAVRPCLMRFAACRAAYLALPAMVGGTEVRGVCCCNGIPIPIRF